jgi:hypothetical protein
MKHLIALAALMVATGVHAQTANADAGSQSTSGAAAQVGSNVQSAGTGSSASNSGATASTQSGAAALGNNIVVQQDFSAPAKTEATLKTEAVNTVKSEATINNVNSGTTTLKNVPSITAPSIGVSAACKSAISGGVAGAGFGVTIGSSINDEECQSRENARVLAQMGQNAEAMSIMCMMPAVMKAAPKKCREAFALTGAEEPK